MIDQELDHLARALIAATDRLESEDFKSRQARYLEIEAERNSLAESLEADESAVLRAQEALQAHLSSGQASYAADLETLPESAAGDPDGILEPEPVDASKYLRAFPEDDEYATPRANGAHTEN